MESPIVLVLTGEPCQFPFMICTRGPKLEKNQTTRRVRRGGAKNGARCKSAGKKAGGEKAQQGPEKEKSNKKSSPQKMKPKPLI